MTLILLSGEAEVTREDRKKNHSQNQTNTTIINQSYPGKRKNPGKVTPHIYGSMQDVVRQHSKRLHETVGANLRQRPSAKTPLLTGREKDGILIKYEMRTQKQYHSCGAF